MAFGNLKGVAGQSETAFYKFRQVALRKTCRNGGYGFGREGKKYFTRLFK